MKDYKIPSVTNIVKDGWVMSVAAAFASGALAAIGVAAMKGDRSVTSGIVGLEPCLD